MACFSRKLAHCTQCLFDGFEIPHDEYRKGQRELAVAAYKTIRTKQKLFVEAPTGTGKTISTLFPALKAVGEEEGEKIFI